MSFGKTAESEMSFWSHPGNAQMLGGLRKDSEQASVIIGLIVAWNSLGSPGGAGESEGKRGIWRGWTLGHQHFVHDDSFAENASRTLILCFATVLGWSVFFLLSLAEWQQSSRL